MQKFLFCLLTLAIPTNIYASDSHNHIVDINYEIIFIAIAIAVTAGVLGSFILWRRMAYFGDSLAHSALLGVAMGILFKFNITLAVIIMSFVFSILLITLKQRKLLATDTLLGILAHGSLAIGLVSLGLTGQHIDLHDYLLGSLANIEHNDLYIIYSICTFIIFIIYKNWQNMILITVNENIAKAEGVNVLKNEALFMFIVTLFVAITLNIIGILLITSLLIIPAASARIIAKTPFSMIIISCILAIISTISGIISASELNLEIGPTIITCSVIIFILTNILTKK